MTTESAAGYLRRYIAEGGDPTEKYSGTMSECISELMPFIRLQTQRELDQFGEGEKVPCRTDPVWPLVLTALVAFVERILGPAHYVPGEFDWPDSTTTEPTT